jgi:hypothetical protein
MVAMIFGNPRALFPILAVVQFHRGPEAVGLLFYGFAVGALVGALTAGWIRHVERQGRAVLVAIGVWARRSSGSDSWAMRSFSASRSWRWARRRPGVGCPARHDPPPEHPGRPSWAHVRGSFPRRAGRSADRGTSWPACSRPRSARRPPSSWEARRYSWGSCCWPCSSPASSGTGGGPDLRPGLYQRSEVCHKLGCAYGAAAARVGRMSANAAGGTDEPIGD